MSGSPLRWPTKQVCIKCPFTQDLSSSPTSLYIYIYMYIYVYIQAPIFRPSLPAFFRVNI